MTIIDLTTEIDASIERVFDLARDLDLHAASMAHTGELAVAGRTSGRVDAGDTVTWRARHFGLWWTLTSRITVVEPPVRFEDVQEHGPFAWFRHEHRFEAIGRATRMHDHWEHRSPFGPIGRLVDNVLLRRYMRSLLVTRNKALKRAAEGAMTAPIAADRTNPRLSATGPSPLLAGLVVWFGTMVILPAPLAARILLLAPLVVIPRLLPLLPLRNWIGGLGGWASFLAAVPLLVAFSLAPGPTAAAFVLPWLGFALVGTMSAFRHGLAHFPSALLPRRFPDLGIDVALGFWGVGAVFVLVDRLGIDTGFSSVIVLLTATHFHFAGFGLLALASLLAAPRPWVRVSVLGLIAGIPLTALGFVLSSDLINAVGAMVVGVSGMGVAIALLTGRLRSRAGWLSRAAGVALLVGMPMGIAWSVAILTGLSFVDLETMVRTHGALNSIAVLLAVIAYRA